MRIKNFINSDGQAQKKFINPQFAEKTKILLSTDRAPPGSACALVCSVDRSRIEKPRKKERNKSYFFQTSALRLGINTSQMCTNLPTSWLIEVLHSRSVPGSVNIEKKSSIILVRVCK